ncbi:MAG: hypothetical protein H0T62_04250 [Parachlamydiaceae bacterium]|nr:hypothetical protein [Parachlamydiaceae bacterium]
MIKKIFISSCINEANKSAENFESESQSQIYLNITIIDPEHDLVKSKKSAHEIQFSSAKSKVLYKISKFESLHNMSLAIETTIDIMDSKYQSKAFLNFVLIEIKNGDLSQAKYWAKKIKDPNFQLNAFLEIAKDDPQHDLTQTRQIVQSIDSKFLLKAFLNIAEVDPFHDFTEAILFAETLENDKAKDKAFLEIIKTQVKYNLVEAKKTAKSIKTNIGKFRGFINDCGS